MRRVFSYEKEQNGLLIISLKVYRVKNIFLVYQIFVTIHFEFVKLILFIVLKHKNFILIFQTFIKKWYRWSFYFSLIFLIL